MTEVVTCVHHEKLKKSTHVQEVQSKVTHVYASSSSETSFMAPLLCRAKQAIFSARVNSPCRDVPEDEISHLANSRKTFLQSNVCL